MRTEVCTVKNDKPILQILLPMSFVCIFFMFGDHQKPNPLAAQYFQYTTHVSGLIQVGKGLNLSAFIIIINRVHARLIYYILLD